MPHAVSTMADVHESHCLSVSAKKTILFFSNCCRVTPDGVELVKWEHELGVELNDSQFSGAGLVS